MSEKASSNKQVSRTGSDQHKDKIAVQILETRTNALEEQLRAISKSVKTLSSEMKRLSILLSGSEQFDAEMAKFRLEVGKTIEKKTSKQLDDRLLAIGSDVKAANAATAEMKQAAASIAKMEKEIDSLRAEDDRLKALLSDNRKLMDEIHAQYLEDQQKMASIESIYKRNIKTIPDLATEVSALQKRSDDQRANLELAQDQLRKAANRVEEYIAEDEKRTASYRSLIDEMKLTQYEHEKTWRDWMNRYDLINKTAVELENKLNALDDAQRKARSSQKGLDDATLRIERRINEIAEMQRLAEDRVRQEWESYMTDEQKRWKGYMVSNDEALSEARRQIENLKNHLTTLEDSSRQGNDTLQMLSEETQKKLQGFLELYHEWAAVNADILSRSKTR